VDARQRAPGAADRVEGAAPARLQRREAAELRGDDLLRLLQRLLRDVLQREPAERQRLALADVMAADVDQFERAAAEVADDAVRL